MAAVSLDGTLREEAELGQKRHQLLASQSWLAGWLAARSVPTLADPPSSLSGEGRKEGVVEAPPPPSGPAFEWAGPTSPGER